jgi:predicted nuclease of predicted toxin-antitoxin system
MKIKLDENLPAELVELLITHGHDADTVPSELLHGSDDCIVFEVAWREGRMLITQDLDFSDVRRFVPGTHPGILLIRLRNPSRRLLIDRMK